MDNIRSILIEQFTLTDSLYWIFGVTTISTIFFYGWYRCKHIKKHKDFLEFSLWKNSNKYGIDGWSISHYLFFLVYGFLYPNTFMLTMICGALWELFECYVGIAKPKLLSGLGFCTPLTSGNKQKIWWYGKPSDIIFNSLGFITGKRVHNFFMK
tara:strand:+ start:2610 stop:3071 length:462 start_codon:yes stop_codon:yes gene_type:complete